MSLTLVLWLLVHHCQAHLCWCWEHVRWNLNMWRNVTFSPDSPYDTWIVGSKYGKERFGDCCINRVTSFGGSSVMVWDDISLTGKFCSRWQSHISTVWDQTLSSKMTAESEIYQSISRRVAHQQS